MESSRRKQPQPVLFAFRLCPLSLDAHLDDFGHAGAIDVVGLILIERSQLMGRADVLKEREINTLEDYEHTAAHLSSIIDKASHPLQT